MVISPPPVLTVANTNWITLRLNLALPPMTQRYGTNHQFLGKRQPTLLP